MQSLRSVGGMVKAAGRKEQRPGGVKICVGRRVSIDDSAVGPMPGEQPIGQLQMLTIPAPCQGFSPRGERAGSR